MSFWKRAVVAAKSIVSTPTKIIKTCILEDIDKSGEKRKSSTTPAVTIVAAWIKAETGVGPSIASGSQVWKPNWADLAITPRVINKRAGKREEVSKNKKDELKNKEEETPLFKKLENKKLRSKDPKIWTIWAEPNIKKQSPNLLTTIALTAALLAAVRSVQKLINKNEHKPTPSHPMNNWIKLPEETRTSIKKVNKDKKQKNRGKAGSPRI
jgi:hypothetical protein